MRPPVLTLLLPLSVCWAFLPSTPLARGRLTSLTSSSSDDDEISKLIGKRNQIKRKKKEEPPPEPSEPVVDLDLDKLPEFTTERPVRRASTPAEEEEKTDSKPSKEAPPIVDFMGDYQDENDMHIPNRMGVSTAAWGGPLMKSSGKLTKRQKQAGMFVPGDVQLALDKILRGGITLVETAPTYGAALRKDGLSAEDILKQCLDEKEPDTPEVQLLVGLGTSAWRNPRLVQSLSDSCDRLGQPLVDLYQVPKSPLFPRVATSLATAIELGQCNSVGVSGITRPRALARLQSQLDDRGVVLTSNCFDFSLTRPERVDLIDACKELGIIPFVSDPLDGGLASGVYTATNPSGGRAGATAKFSFQTLEKLQPLHSVQETVAERVRTRVIREMRNLQDRVRSRYGPPPQINTDITTTQVALNYVIAKGGVPLPEVNTPAEADEVLGCLGWTLTDEEVDMLDAAVALCKLK